MEDRLPDHQDHHQFLGSKQLAAPSAHTLLPPPMATSISLGSYIQAGSFKHAAPHGRGLATSLNVRCMSEQVGSSGGDSSSSNQKPPSPSLRAKFSDVLAFSGPAPERINGRLAMVGFATAVAVEAASGNDVVAQLTTGGGLPWFLYFTALFSMASLVPMLEGMTAESKSHGVMTSTAELWNGRAAMLGLVAMLLTEYLKGGPLV